MREIKFRLFSKQLNKFMEPWEFCVDGRGLIFIIGEHPPLQTNKKRFLNASKEYFILSRSTGLEDKNGKEIYEGDIVKPPYDKPFFKIEYMQLDNCGDCYKDSGIGFNLYLNDAKELEVIGNVYENPGLLNATD